MDQNHMKKQAYHGRSERQFAEGDQVSATATIQANFPQGQALSEVSTQISWSLYYAQACGTSRLSVSFS